MYLVVTMAVGIRRLGKNTWRSEIVIPLNTLTWSQVTDRHSRVVRVMVRMPGLSSCVHSPVSDE